MGSIPTSGISEERRNNKASKPIVCTWLQLTTELKVRGTTIMLVSTAKSWPGTADDAARAWWIWVDKQQTLLASAK